MSVRGKAGKKKSAGLLPSFSHPDRDERRSLLQDPRFQDARVKIELERPKLFLAPLQPNELIIAPESWNPDSTAAACTDPDCGLAFTITRRRHHCRHCGGVFCDDHTIAKAHVPQTDSLVRLCFPCADLIKLEAIKEEVLISDEKASDARTLLQKLVARIPDAQPHDKARIVRALRNFAVGAPHRAMLAEYAGPMLVSLLNVPDEAVQTHAAATLANMTVSGSEYTDLLRTNGGVIPMVVLLLTETNETTQHVAAAAIEHFARDADTSAEFGAAGAVYLLLTLLMAEGKKREETRQQSALALIGLSFNPRNRTIIQELGGLGPLMRIVSSSSNSQYTAALTKALAAFSEQGSGYHDDHPVALLTLVNSPDKTVQERALTALRNATSTDPSVASYFDAVGLCKLIACLSGVGEDYARIRRLALQTIVNVLGNASTAAVFQSLDGASYIEPLAVESALAPLVEQANAALSAKGIGSKRPRGHTRGPSLQSISMKLHEVEDSELVKVVSYIPTAFTGGAMGSPKAPPAPTPPSGSVPPVPPPPLASTPSSSSILSGSIVPRSSGTIAFRLKEDRGSKKSSKDPTMVHIHFSPAGSTAAIGPPPVSSAVSATATCEKDVFLALITGSLELSMALMTAQLVVDNLERFLGAMAAFSLTRDNWLAWLRGPGSPTPAAGGTPDWDAPEEGPAPGEAAARRNAVLAALERDSLPGLKDPELKLAFLFVPYAFVPGAEVPKTSRFFFMIQGNPTIDVTIGVTPIGARVLMGAVGEADVTISAPRDTILSIMNGSEQPALALMSGRMVVNDLSKLMQFNKTFKFERTKFEAFREKMAPIIVMSQQQKAAEEAAAAAARNKDAKRAQGPRMNALLLQSFVFLHKCFRGADWKGAVQFVLTDRENTPPIIVRVNKKSLSIEHGTDAAPQADSDFMATVLAPESAILAFLSGRKSAKAIVDDGLFFIPPGPERDAFLRFAGVFKFSTKRFTVFRAAMGLKDQESPAGGDGEAKEASPSGTVTPEEAPEEPPPDVKLEEAFSFLPLAYKGVKWDGAIQYVLSTGVEGDETIGRTVEIQHQTENPVTVHQGLDVVDKSKVLCTARMTRETFISVSEGSLHPVRAFMTGAVVVDDKSGMLKFASAFKFNRVRYRRFVEALRASNRMSVAVRAVT